MLYNLVEVDLASPRTITINMDSVEKFGDFIRRRVRLYNSYIKMTKRRINKKVLKDYDNSNWLNEEDLEEEEF